MSYEEAAKLVLVAHQRIDPGGCLCGWGGLGRDYAEHQVQKLKEAGLLKED